MVIGYGLLVIEFLMVIGYRLVVIEIRRRQSRAIGYWLLRLSGYWLLVMGY